MAVERGGLGWRKAIRRFWRDYELAVIWGVGTVACILGCWGFWKLFQDPGVRVPVPEILYRSLRLFVLHGEPFEQPIPWQLELSRFLAPTVTVVAALAALGKVFHRQWQMLWLRIRRPHAVVCGLGRKGLQLVRDLRADGKKVVVIDRDEQNDYLELCRDLGAVVVLGDATEAETLRLAMAHRADRVFAACGDDGANVEIAVHVYDLHKAHARGSQRRIECRLHIVDPMLCEALKSHGLLRETGDKFETRVMNIFENSARLLLDERPLDRDFIGAGDPRTVHLVIVGFGQMGQSIALQAARIAHFANGKRLRLTILDRDADRRKRSFFARYPRFGDVCDTQFIDSDFEDAQFFDDLRAWAGAPEFLLSVAVCLDNDSVSLKCALGLARRLKKRPVPIWVRMEEDVGLASLLNCEGHCPDVMRHIRAFGQITSAASLSKWLSPGQDGLARAVHEKFRKDRAAEGRSPADPSMRAWDDLDEGLKDSNRQFADHIPVKLRAIGCVVDDTRPGQEPVTAFTPEEADVLAPMEHARWNAERFLAGWQLGPADKANKISPYLVEWSAIPDDVKKYDYDLVALIPELVAMMGRRIYRAG